MNAPDPNSSLTPFHDAMRRVYGPVRGEGHGSTIELDVQIRRLADARGVVIRRQRLVARWAWVGTAAAAGLAMALWWPVLRASPAAVPVLSANAALLDATADRRLDVLDALAVSADEPERAQRILREVVRIRATGAADTPGAKG